MSVPAPPIPFTPATEILAAGSLLYRVHGNLRGPAEFNATGLGSGRFHFFADSVVPGAPLVPVLYAASTEQAAVAETILHDVPLSGGQLVQSAYNAKVMNRLTPKREIRLAAFHGLGLRQLGVTAGQLTDTDRTEYAATVRWAIAAHGYTDSAARLDGIVWMSARCNTDRAYMFFGDRLDEDDFASDQTFARIFADLGETGWLSDLCAPLGIDVLLD